MKRIICIGNRYITEDSTGQEVYQYLIKGSLPDGIEIIDGGLAGLDLIYLMEGAERVVFVDTVSGFGVKGEIHCLEASEVAELAEDSFGHIAGLPYLLRVFPEVCDGELPQIVVIGLEGSPQEVNIKKASELAVKLASGNREGEVKFA